MMTLGIRWLPLRERRAPLPLLVVGARTAAAKARLVLAASNRKFGARLAPGPASSTIRAAGGRGAAARRRRWSNVERWTRMERPRRAGTGQWSGRGGSSLPPHTWARDDRAPPSPIGARVARVHRRLDERCVGELRPHPNREAAGAARTSEPGDMPEWASNRRAAPSWRRSHELTSRVQLDRASGPPRRRRGVAGSALARSVYAPGWNASMVV